MKIDTRSFTHAGSSADANGVYKARFANGVDTRAKVMEKVFGYSNVTFVELPMPMTKLEAIAYLLETKPEGVNLASLEAKRIYINNQTAKINGTVVGRKRGRPVGSGKKKVVSTVVTSEPTEVVIPTPESLVNKIIATARGNSIRAKAARVAAAKK